MNRQRRTELHRVADTIANCMSIVEQFRDDEQEYLDNMPEAFQQGEKAEKAQAAIDAMENALEDLASARDAIEIEATA